jgi:hypothetical protein
VVAQPIAARTNIPPTTRPVVFQNPALGFPVFKESTDALGMLTRQLSQSGGFWKGTPLTES